MRPRNNTQALVGDLRSREKTIRQLEAKNATLAAVKVAATPAPAPRERERPRQGSAKSARAAVAAATGAAAVGSSQSVLLPPRRTLSGVSVEAKADGRRHVRAASAERRNAARAAPGAPESVAWGAAARNPLVDKDSDRGSANTANAATVPSSVRPARKQLAPQAAVVPGRVATISYPRGGTRATFTPSAAATAIGPGTAGAGAGDSTLPTEAASTTPRKGDGCRAGKKSGSSGAPQAVAGGAREDGGRSEAPRGIVEEQAGSGGPRPSPRQQRRPSQDRVAESGSSPQGACRQPGRSTSRVALLPNDKPTTSAACSGAAKTLAAEETDVFGGKGGGGGGDGTGSTAGRGINEGRSCRVGEPEAEGECAADPARSAAPAATSVEGSPCRMPPPSAAEKEPQEVESGAEQGLRVDIESPRPDEMGAESEPAVFRSRLVEGVPVLKYGGRGKPKAKVLWVTPDLSEIFYTQAGR